MGALALWLKGKVLGNQLPIIFIGIILVVIGIIVIPNMEQIKEKLGFETRTTLKAQVVQQEQVIEHEKEVNTDLTNQIKADDIMDEMKDKAVTDQVHVVQEQIKVVEQRIVKKQKKIQKLKTKHPKLMTVKAVSQVQIQSLWTAYCEAVHNSNAQCGDQHAT